MSAQAISETVPGVQWLGLATYAWAAAGLVLAMRSRVPGSAGAAGACDTERCCGRVAGALWSALAAVAAWGVQLMVLATAAPQAPLHRPGWLLLGLLPAFAGAAASVAWRLPSGTVADNAHLLRLMRQLPALLLLAAGWLALPVLATSATPHPDALPWLKQALWPAAAAALLAAALCQHAPRLREGGALRIAAQAAVLAVLLVAADLAVITAAGPALEAGIAVQATIAPAALPPLQDAAWPDGPLPAALPLTAIVALVLVPPVALLLALAGVLALRYDALQARTHDAMQAAAGSHPLTHLPNRQRFEQHLQAAAMRADRHRQRVAVMCINVDGLKTINESFGPAAGDALLCGMAQRLTRLAGPGDVVAHPSGDEFLVLLAGNPDRDTAARAASHAIARLSDVLLLEAREIATSCSVGLAMYPEDGGMDALVTHAAAAVRCAKRNGRASYCFFDSRMTEGSREQADLLHDLRRAIERRQLELVYQPKIHARGGHVTGAEALLRWRHPQRGLISPVMFVPLAERAGLIGALGDWVIDDACRQMRAWLDGGACIKVSINLSVHQLRQPDLVQRIRGAMQRHGVPAGQLSCEITESAAMDDTGTTLSVVKELAAAGVQLAIDDFGTGYSSLGYLRRLPVSELKIDRSFVLDLATSPDACAIVDAVVKLAHALGLTVVAEGVETEAQRRLLDKLGCDELQGFLFAKPMPARLLATWAVDTLQRPRPRLAATAGTHVA